MTTVFVGNVELEEQDLRYRNHVDSKIIITCGPHRQNVQNSPYGTLTMTPVADKPDCALCTAGIPVDKHLKDEFGHDCCGEDFMAGTICSLAPGHDGGHGTECQECGGDWYMGSCTCADE